MSDDFNGRGVSLRIKAAMATRRRQLQAETAPTSFAAIFGGVDEAERQREAEAEDAQLATEAQANPQRNRGRLSDRRRVWPNKTEPIGEARVAAPELNNPPSAAAEPAHELQPAEPAADPELGLEVELPGLMDLLAAADAPWPEVRGDEAQIGTEIDPAVVAPAPEIEQPIVQQTVVDASVIIDAAEMPVAHEADDEVNAIAEIAVDQEPAVEGVNNQISQQRGE